MYAIIESGGKQYKVEEGLVLRVQKMDLEAGAEIVMDKVLAVGEGADLKIGAPYVEGAKAACEVVGHGRAKKIIVFWKRRRQGSFKKQGHRQDYTTVKVKSIQA